MKKMHLAALAGLTAGAWWSHQQYYRTWLPNYRFKRLQARLARHHRVTGGYITNRPQPVNRGDVLASAYPVGFQVDGQWFTGDLLGDGTLLHWRRLDVKARD